ncbi:hypothetical protein CHS0354_035956 [Potamilus streckersoni]|uniref:non-specific serine/threonine protein kinase n=1 Tax=Potamilus streckersoni TaxID=2493646 RepID=A0AAE0TG89_9BIVA|nr:hypothetical protein CHS0354_035956 [Potamilus streckersoni]
MKKAPAVSKRKKSVPDDKPPIVAQQLVKAKLNLDALSNNYLEKGEKPDNASKAPLQQKANVQPKKQLPGRKDAVNLGENMDPPTNTDQRRPISQSMPVHLLTHNFRSDQAVHLGRKDLFDDFGILDFYPLHKIQEIILMWKENAEVHLSFSGVEQLTDLVFQVFLLYYNHQRYSTVKKLELVGCIHLTDQALVWIADCFPELKSISLKGCDNVTETGLYQLLANCKQLKDISLVGTGVSILPSQMTQLLSVDVNGCPLISPDRESYEKDGINIMSVANYQKPKDKDVVKLCILQSSGATKSLLKFLTGKQDQKLDPVSVEFNFPLSPSVTGHLLEFSETVADIFVTKRALFVLPIEANADKMKEAASKLFGHINYILSKDPKATIMIVRVNLGEGKAALSGLLKREVDILMQNEKDRLAKEADILKNPQKLSELNFEAQRMMAKACVLRNQIEVLNLLTADVNLSKPGPEDKSLLIEALLKGTKNVCNSYPEYQEIASPVFAYLQSNTVEKMYFDGASFLENSKTSQCKLQLLQIMVGKIVIFHDVDDAPVTFMTSWIGKILNMLFSSPPSGNTNQKHFYSVEDNVLVWQEEELAQVLAADVGEAQIKIAMVVLHRLDFCLYSGVKIAIPILHKLGICLYSSQNVLIPYKFLPKQPQCPVEHYFPSTDPASSGNDIVMVTCIFTLSHAVPLLAMHRIINILSKIRRPMLVWQEGAVFQEVVVEILIMRQISGAESSIVLCGQSIHSSREKTELRDMVWMSVEQARIIVEFILLKMNLLYSMSCKFSQDKPATLSSVVGGHILRLPVDGQDNKKGKKCTTCGCTPEMITLLSAVFESTTTKFVKAETIETGSSSVEVMGNLLNFTQSGKATVHTFVSVLDHNMCQFTVLQGDLHKINIMLRNFYNDFVINLGSKKLESVFKEVTSEGISEKRQEIGSLPPTSVISIGDKITLRLDYSDETQEGQEFCWLTILVNAEIVKREKVPMVMYRPSLEVTDEAIVLVSRLGTDLNKDGKVKIGMKLEAVDIKHPHLVCVATIDNTDAEGQVLIHFDGWSTMYDYWTTPDFKGLHPLGYMKMNSSKHTQLNNTLQKPRGYEKTFEWHTYCQEEKALPVPFEFFTAEQREDTTPDITNEVLAALELISIFPGVQSDDYHPCASVTNRTKVYEQKIIKESIASEELYEFFGNYSKFFCILPSQFDTQQLRYPSLRCLSDLAHQMIHIICPGLKMEMLHFLNDKGFPASVQSLENMLDYVQACCKGMLHQEEIMPNMCDSLCSGLTGETGELEEVWMKKILFLYVAILDIIQDKTSSWTERVSKQSGEVIELFNKASQMLETNKHFTDLDSFIKCTGHKAASSVGQSLTSIPTENFDKFYKFIDKLDFRDNFIEKLFSDFFQKFVYLEYLCLCNNQLVTLPTEIETAHHMTYLDVSMNNIIDLPNLSKLERLTHLNLSDNPLHKFPDFVFKLSKLKELNLANIGTIESLKGIGNLTDLTKLSLARNEIKDIPDEMGSLKVLSDLDLSGVPWFPPLTATTSSLSWRAFNNTLNMNNVTRRINEMTRQQLFKEADIDESYQLTQNELELLNQELYKKYSRLGEGYLVNTNRKTYRNVNLVNNATGGFPPVLLNMKSLRCLNLSYHGLRYIPDDIKQLSNLHELNLSNNPYLETLSAELGGMPLKSLNLNECPTLKTPPKEIVSRGFVAVYGYLKRLRLGSVPCKRTKLMIVGLGGAGKTSLVRALTSSTFQAYMDYGESITDGIDIMDWQVPLKDEPLPLTYSVWDFAGQTVYYNTHQFFLSNRAVYLLLWNIRLGYEHAGLDFWLSSIACHAPKAPILVVGTHCDKVEKTKLPQESLQSRFPQIAGFHYVSSYSGEGIQNLKEQLVKITLAQEYMGEQIPQAWLTFEKRLVGEHESKDTSLLPFKTVESIASACGIFESNELIQAIQFLHDLGSVQFFNTDFLRNQVVIYPQWIVNVMACIVTVHVGPIQDGKLVLKDMKVVWKDYDEQLHPWLLRLTEEFDLTCPLPNEEANIVPCLLPDSEPQFEWPHADPAKNVKESKMVYHFKYLPAGLFNRAQVRLHQYSDGSVLWKKGSFLKKNNHIALILQTGTSEVTVKAQGFRPGNLLFMVHEVFETLISESYAGVKYDFSIPCLDCQNMNVKEPSMLSASKVHRAMELNAPFLQCEKFFHILSIPELQGSMPSDKSDFDNHLRKSVQELIEINQNISTHVFFLYTKKNVPDLAKEKEVVHPGTVMEDLRKEGFRVSYCDQPESADMEALTLTVKQVEVVLIGMSDELCSIEDAKKLLLYIKDILRKPFLLVLLGTTMKWQKSNLSMVLGTEVYVSLQQIERYPQKIKELYEAINKKKSSHTVETEDIPECFISYCWTNSHDAIEKGSKKKEGSLGWGDPREIKKFLQEKGIPCWLDIERVGGGGLFEDIADGLRKAKVLVAFVSNEYVQSQNCLMEFRFALTTLRIPVILAIVGTGYKWEESEIGMLAVGHHCPKVNFQFQNDTGHLELLKLVQERLPNRNDSSNKGNQSADTQRQTAFQEVLELAQRKFLRHISTYAEEDDTIPYPRLICVDLVNEEEKTRKIEKKKVNADGTESKKEASSNEQDQTKTADVGVKREEVKKEDKQAKDGQNDVSGDVEIVHKSKYCFRLLCEDEQGWHVVAPAIPFPELSVSEEQDFISTLAAYLMRLMVLLKHGHMQLTCLTTPEGQKFQQKLEEMAAKNEADFKEAYFRIRKSVMKKDKEMEMGNITRVQLQNGKIHWLCEEHKSLTSSKTEALYKNKLTIKEVDIPIPKDVAEAPIPISQPQVEEEKAETVDKPNPAPSRRIFKQQGSQIQDQPRLQRQSSQACSVM